VVCFVQTRLYYWCAKKNCLPSRNPLPEYIYFKDFQRISFIFSFMKRLDMSDVCIVCAGEQGSYPGWGKRGLLQEKKSPVPRV
jgi:hypothetical protein